MKKSRLFMAAGAIVLAISAVFATKANKKFTNSFHTGFAAGGSSMYVKTAGGGLWLTTYSGNPAGSNTPAYVTISTVTPGSGKALIVRTLLRTGDGTTNKPLYLL